MTTPETTESEDANKLLGELEHVATALFGGHFTIMRFGSNWRVGFGTPSERHDITAMADGCTFPEAARKAIQRVREAVWADQAKRRADIEAEFLAAAAKPSTPPAA